MKDLYVNEFDGVHVVTWFTDNDFECSVEAGDYVNIRFRDGSRIECGRIVDVCENEHGIVVNNGSDSVVCLFENMVDIDKVYHIETEPVYIIEACTRGGITCRKI